MKERKRKNKKYFLFSPSKKKEYKRKKEKVQIIFFFSPSKKKEYERKERESTK